MTRSPPRLFGIPAARAPVVAVFRRGPSDWSHGGRWDVARGIYEPGAWIHGNLYPQRCDLSPELRHPEARRAQCGKSARHRSAT